MWGSWFQLEGPISDPPQSQMSLSGEVGGRIIWTELQNRLDGVPPEFKRVLKHEDVADDDDDDDDDDDASPIPIVLPIVSNYKEWL